MQRVKEIWKEENISIVREDLTGNFEIFIFYICSNYDEETYRWEKLIGTFDSFGETLEALRKMFPMFKDIPEVHNYKK